ncbi:MAG: hypothetical protein JWM19_996 [Actinomycetia bacterium]|nr:hypothetical protein [Actinomycetes bacterium]
MSDYRLLVTGSREYDDRMALRTALDRVLDSLREGVTLVVVCGDEDPAYATGAERLAGEWALEVEGEGLSVRLERRPADWEGPCRTDSPDGAPGCEPDHREWWRDRSLCPAAGSYRNEEVCQSGVHGGLAALRTGTKSSIAKDCLRRMARHQIAFELLVQGEAKGLPQDVLGLPRQS